jgi:hypothetical protein
MSANLLPALSEEAIFAKSRVYFHRALRAKNTKDVDEYQLWASLALELLGKAALARIHPSLIADPSHQISLFAASGVVLGTDIKTITWHTLFERLRHLSPRFGVSVKGFCDAIAQRRNAELHSGEVPFKAMLLDAWEGRFWHAAQIILEIMKLSLEEWLGADQAKAPREIVQMAAEAAVSAALIRVEQAKEAFEARPKKEREAALADAAGKSAFHYRNLFKLVADAEWGTTCPACSGKAYLAGMQFHEEVLDDVDDDDSWEETVERHYEAEELRCPVCTLHLYSHEEIVAVGLDTNHQEIDTRERTYEPDYGND